MLAHPSKPEGVAGDLLVAGGSPALVSISLFSPCVYDVDGRTVAVHPVRQIVLSMLACVTSAKYAPGGSLKGERRDGGALRSTSGAVAASGMGGGASGGIDAHAVSRSASAAPTASARRFESSGTTSPLAGVPADRFAEDIRSEQLA